MNKKVIITGGVLIGMIIIFFAVRGSQNDSLTDIMVEVKRDVFNVNITTTGELEAKNSVKIMGPSGLRNFRIYQVNIQEIIDEGTEVKKGDFVASLDPSDLTTKMKDAETKVEQENSKYIQTQLDTTLQMRQARDELINLKYGVEEQEIKLDQSQFEPPATIKQEEINLEKAKRAYNQAKENYKIKQRQNVAKMNEVGATLTKARRELEGMAAMVTSFTIVAPEDGMLIYKKDWDGKPIKAGSQIGVWDPVVATLPDLSTMMSKTYINEVDVRKVKAGQSVEIGLDAFPEKKLKGKVMSVANVGEQRPNSDAKVFQVNVQVAGSDPLLRPAMTTSNSIIAKTVENALFIPLECLHSQFDSITYVFKKEGIKTIKQEVQIGDTNTDEAIILAGLEEKEKVFLSVPNGYEEDEVILIPEMDGKRSQPEAEEIEEEPEEEMITLPNGKKIPASKMKGMRSGGKRKASK
ncbi:MAG: efflux RND transporter periplasmic adaptor subunit [Cyclobacteriaceae bacterium]|nr:efflux RND transporter periplasmic adaptor subunit [Cyclobacteriaceae bacterium]